ncbi:serine hydrolase [Planomonospora sp. ID82291]|uniref:serine hydrolase n=1 Tax=Planomonospora sp. ID82291 TaxID=2738136 RepID=UPI0018C42C82|nr:serine hydrolase [Planomonospora sp. ID82291]MBG0815185.1 serine hydrolase [Planomonospora sp. ID82291]
MTRPRCPSAVAAAVLVPALLGGCVAQRAVPRDLGRPRAGPPSATAWPVPLGGAPVVTSRPAPPESSALSGAGLTRVLDRFLGVHGGDVTAAVRDLTTGRTYHYHADLQLPTASTSKVDILMALLLRTPWRELDARARRDADRMIRLSDNDAADRLYERIGLETGLAEANRRFGLERTDAPPGRCVDLYCWGITRTTAEDQIRLLTALATETSPLAAEDRGQVLRLMGEVIPEQRWGITAAACDGDRVALKNGWLRRVSNGRWVVVSAGLISGGGRDYAVAVLTEDNGSMGEGVLRVEGTAERMLSAVRGGRKCREDGPRAGGGDDGANGRARESLERRGR